MSESSRPNAAAPPRVQFRTIGEIRAASSGAWLHFFAPGLIRIRRMHIYPQVYAGRYFITSERPRIVLNATRRYTIREIKPDGSIAVVGDLQGHETFDCAERALQDLLCSPAARDGPGHSLNGDGSAGTRATHRRTGKGRDTAAARDADIDWFDHSLVDELRRLRSGGRDDVVTPPAAAVPREPAAHTARNRAAANALDGQPTSPGLAVPDAPGSFRATTTAPTIADKGRTPGDPPLLPLAVKGLAVSPGEVHSGNDKEADSDYGSRVAEMRPSARLPAFLSRPGPRISPGTGGKDGDAKKPQLVRRLFGRRRLSGASMTPQHRNETDVSDDDWFRRLSEDLSKIDR